MSNLHLFLSLAGFTTALFAWFRFDINKRFDDMKASINNRFDDVNASMNGSIRRHECHGEQSLQRHARLDKPALR